ncbi:phosphotransferase [Streptomyces albidoflavus]|uniref:phosphotransferase n=1 Tax=Streptomyces albidoflavus TaxID=1886 RepID=UPI0033DB26CC
MTGASPAALRRVRRPGRVDEVVRWAMAACSLSPVVRWAVSEVGYDDCNIMADTRDGRYVVKIFHTSRSPALCARYVDVVRRVTEAGVAHPRLHRADGSALLHHRPTGNRLMVMDRVEGTTFLDADACPDDTELDSVVEQTYRIHTLDLYPEYVHDWWAIPQIATLAAEVAHLLTPEDQDRVAAAVETFGRLRVGTLPQVFSHGDLTKANLIRTPSGVPAVLDLAVSNRYARVHDLSMLAVNVLHGSPRPLPERVALLTGLYARHEPLTAAEHAALPGYVLAAAAMELLGAEREWSREGNRSEETRYLRELGRTTLRAAADWALAPAPSLTRTRNRAPQDGTHTDERNPMTGPASPVNSWDEFTQLREIIVGDAAHARIPRMTDPSAWLACYPTMTPAELKRVEAGAFPRQVVEESDEDLAQLTETLRGLGVTTHRPPAVDHSRSFSSPYWEADGYISYCPRDITLVAGSTLIEVASPMRSRYFELFNLRPLFQRYMLEGATWIAAPRPQLRDELYTWDEEGRPLLGEAEPVFDAANVLRVGQDFFYQVSRSGNEMGLDWLRSTLRLVDPTVRVHPLRDVYGYTHIDSTITVLRPGLVMLNPARIARDEVPEAFRGWDVLWCPELRPTQTALPYHLSEPWISMNLLMVNPELAIADSDQPELLRALEAKGISVLPHRLRHQRVLGGGFHCVTLDIARDGLREDYFG